MRCLRPGRNDAIRWLICAILLSGIACSHAQSKLNIDTMGARSATATAVTKCFGDSLCTSFVIVIPDRVALHKHLYHSEHVLVLEGEADMQLGDSTFLIKKGDLVFIPRNTFHSARSTGKVPLKVLSLQAPLFDGTDRVMAK